jgi:YggT family protein
METVRREQHTEVVQSDVADTRPVYAGQSAADVNAGGPLRMRSQQSDTITSDPYASRREWSLKVPNAIYLLFGILEGLLGIRFILSLLGANPDAGFAQFIYGITQPFIAPFVGLFGTPSFGGSVFEWNALVALLIYALLAWVLVKVVGLVMGDTRRGVRTTSSKSTRVSDSV